jgi:hypothetical protein
MMKPVISIMRYTARCVKQVFRALLFNDLLLLLTHTMVILMYVRATVPMEAIKRSAVKKSPYMSFINTLSQESLNNEALSQKGLKTFDRQRDKRTERPIRTATMRNATPQANTHSFTSILLFMMEAYRKGLQMAIYLSKAMIISIVCPVAANM